MPVDKDTYLCGVCEAMFDLTQGGTITMCDTPVCDDCCHEWVTFQHTDDECFPWLND